MQNGFLTFQIDNTKEKSDAADVNENIGLKNIRRQLELLYPDHTMQVKNEPSVFNVSLSINLKTHEKNQLPDTGR